MCGSVIVCGPVWLGVAGGVTVHSALSLCPDSTQPQAAHQGMYFSLFNLSHNLHYLFLTYLTPTRPYPHYTPHHSQPHRSRTITLPHIPSNPPTLDYTATADMVPINTQTTHYYTHITHYIHCSQINLSLHFTFSLCCRLTPHAVLYSLFS